MTYQDYRNTYKKLIKSSPDVTSLYTSEEEAPENINHTIIHYEKRGSKWAEIDRTEKKVDFIFYSNVVDPAAVQFFRNLGGYEKVTKEYTRAGFIPVEVVSISPDRQKKTVRKFYF